MGNKHWADLEEERRLTEWKAHEQRRKNAWGVPECAIDAFLEMEDAIGESQARAILNLIEAMKEAA